MKEYLVGARQQIFLVFVVYVLSVTPAQNKDSQRQCWP